MATDLLFFILDIYGKLAVNAATSIQSCTIGIFLWIPKHKSDTLFQFLYKWHIVCLFCYFLRNGFRKSIFKLTFRDFWTNIWESPVQDRYLLIRKVASKSDFYSRGPATFMHYMDTQPTDQCPLCNGCFSLGWYCRETEYLLLGPSTDYNWLLNPISEAP